MRHSYILLIFISTFIYGQQHPLMSALDSSVYPQFIAKQSGSWSNPGIWEGDKVPSDNGLVTIPNGIQVTITKELTARHKFIQVNGNLFMSINNNTQLKVETLSIGSTGYFRIGLSNFRVNPDKQAKIIFTSDGEPIDRLWDKKQITRGLISKGKIRVYGNIKSHLLEFEQDIVAGQSSITFNSGTIPADWEVGDELVLPGTSFVRNEAFEFEDEVLKIKSIAGNTIEFEEAAHNHIRLNNDQSLHFANLTRNVIFESESTDNELQRRGHLMFMSADVEIEHAAMIGLGRTDKSKPLNDISIPIEDIIAGDEDAISASGIAYPEGPKTNVRGRYAVHFHKNGYGNDVNSPPSKILGCVVRDTQGWGFVNHSSHVDFEQNVCYNFVGSGFVTESGDELGNFTDNIAIKGIGDRKYRQVQMVFNNKDRPQPLSDFAFSGEGFWFQGPAVRVVNNVAANCNGAGMFWFTLGSVEIDDNEMIGMDKDIALQAYAMHQEIETWNPRTWKHAPNEVFTADLPILECSDFKGYANLAGFRIRMNNASVLSFFNADFQKFINGEECEEGEECDDDEEGNECEKGDIFRYIDQITPAVGHEEPNTAGRLHQKISNLALWNNEIGIRTRYSSKTTFDNIVVDNGLRYGNTRNAIPGIESEHQSAEYFYENTNVSNYGVGVLIYFKSTDIVNPGIEFISGKLTNVGNDTYKMRDFTCPDAISIEVTNIITTSATINIADHPELKRMVVRYKSEKDHYWNYSSIDNSNSIELEKLNMDTEYAYQVLVGCESTTSKWSDDKFFTTKCTDITGGYTAGAEWTYGTFTALACIGDHLRIRLNTTKGSSVYTKPDGSVVKGNTNNKLSINPMTIDDYGTYTVEYTDEAGCVSNYNFLVIPKSQKNGGYSTGSEWTYGTFTAPACIGDNLRIRLQTGRGEGSSVYTKPDGSFKAGNINNTLVINPVSGDDYGIYSVVYTDAIGCAGSYYFNVIPKSQQSGRYSVGTEWIDETFTAPVCVGDNLRIRLNTKKGSSIYTRPNGSVKNGNVNNTLTINPVSLDDYGTYSVVYTDEVGCVSNYNFNVIPKSQKNGGYSLGAEWVYGTFTAPACVGDNLRIRLQTQRQEGSSIYTKPNNEMIPGNINNTLSINPVSEADYGSYTIAYTDAEGCTGKYNFNVISKNQLEGEQCNGNEPKIKYLSPAEFKLYPNPVLDNEVVFLSGEEIQHIEVFNMMGKQLNSQNFNAQKSLVEIDCSGFESGIYFVRINSKEALKFIVQK